MYDFLEQFGSDCETIPGFLRVAISEVNSGICLYAKSSIPGFDAELASSFNLQVVKAKLNAIEAFHLNQSIEDILITLTEEVHILDISKDNTYFIYLAIDSSQANLGMTKALLNRYKKQLEGKL
ncbi:hypothetical protein [Flavobacterium columnare]|nr:hypothetical protein [Flavobacterium columnare]RVU90302.1 hypothetical protein EH230_04955 [Flavobacterium columnare]